MERITDDKVAHILMQQLKDISDNPTMPIVTGTTEANIIDGKFDDKYWPYHVDSMDELNSLISDMELTDEQRCYVYGRWGSTIMSKIDEYMFSRHQDVRWEENIKSKEVDFFIKDIKFDLKGSNFPTFHKTFWGREIKQNFINGCVTDIDIHKTVEWMYEYQGEWRYSVQNRLFLVFATNNPENLFKMKCYFKAKNDAINQFCDELSQEKLTRYKIYDWKTHKLVDVYAPILCCSENNGNIVYNKYY